MKKRVLSLFLALTLCLTLLPTAVFAAEPNATESGPSTTIEERENEIVIPGGPTEDNGEVGDAPIVSTGAPAEQNTTGSAVAKVGDTEYETLQEILEEMGPAEITLLGNVTEDLAVYAATTIHMGGFSITGDIDAADSLTLTNGTVKGTVKMDGGTFTMTAPANAVAAIDGELNVISGSAYVSGAKVGVQDTLVFGGDSMVITGTDKAVELTKEAEPTNKKLYGSVGVDGDTSIEAVFEDGTYKVGGEVAKKLSNKQAGSSTPVAPVTLTLVSETANVAAGETATFTVTYTGTDTLNAYVQKDAQDENFSVSVARNEDAENTYTVSVAIAEETPTGDYTLYVHETKNASVQAAGIINVTATVAKDNEGNYYHTIKDAIEHAPDGSTITVIAAESQISLPDGIYVENQTGITLDLNGHSLDGCSLNVGGLTVTSQPRTGKLTVIDSSNGNGAVGVAVRDGGTLVFDPKNDKTTLLQLVVYGGTVQLYSGKILKDGWKLYNDVKLADLLPTGEGFAYYNANTDTQLTLEEAASGKYDLVVKSCDHGGASGFDYNADKCPNCGAPAVAYTQLNLPESEGNSWRNFADLQTALDADRNGGSVVRLLTDVSGNYTIDGSTDTGLDLNGHSIHGTIYVGGTKGDMITTTLSNTKNTTTASIDKVVASSGAELAGSGYPAVIGELTLAEGATWENILQQKTLGYKVQGDDGSYKWYAPADVPDGATELTNVIINRLPITSKALSIVKKADDSKVTSTVERNTELQLRASCNAKDATVTFYVKVPGSDTPITFEGTYQKISNSWYYVASPTFGEIGEYDIYFYAEKDGYSVTSAHKKLTVTKLDLSKAEITFPSGTESAYDPYTDATSAPPYTVTYNGKTLTKGVDYTVTDDAYSGGVGTRHLTIKATTNGDYTGQKTAEWEIVPHKVKVSVGDVTKDYDGTTDLPAGTISLVSADSAAIPAGRTLPLSAGSGYELTDAMYDSADASTEEKTISFTIKLNDQNYTFEDDSTEKAFTLNGADETGAFKINQATAPTPGEVTQYVYNDLARTYTLNLATLLPPLTSPCKYGDIEYPLGYGVHFTNSVYYNSNNGMSVSTDGILTLPIVAASTAKVNDEIGTITVPIVSTNYRQFDLTIKVVIGEKITLDKSGVSVSATDITYGQTLAESKLTATGSMTCPRMHTEIPGTFAWKDGAVKPNHAGDYDAEWTFTPAEGYEEYAVATGKVTVTVNRKNISGATVKLKQDSFVYDGNEKTPEVDSVVLDNVPLTSLKDYGYIVVKQSNVGTYHFTITGDGNYTGEVKVTWKITAREVTPTIEVASCTYTGDALEPEVTLKDGETVIPKDEYTVEYSNNTNAGAGLVTIKDVEGGNYVIVERSQDFPISRAAAPMTTPGSLTITNGLHKTTYSFDLSALLPKLTAPCDYGTITYGKPDTDLGEGTFVTLVDSKTGALTLEVTRNSTGEGRFGTIKVLVTTSNYQDISLTINVSAKNKLTPVLDGSVTLSPAEITYGQKLSEITITGTMKDPDTGATVEGTFSWKYPDLVPDIAGTYVGEWKFTPKDKSTYTEATGKVNVTVNNAKQSATLVMQGYTYGETPFMPYLKDRTGNTEMPVTYRYFAEGGGTTQEWDIDNPPALSAGTYTMRATIAGTQNYDSFTTEDVQFTVAKATPDFTNGTTYKKPTGLTAKYGQTLTDVKLSNPAGNLDGEWSWMDSTVSVGNASTTAKTFKAKFTPKDIENYNTVENIELEVMVNKAAQAMLTIQGKDSVAYGETLTLKTTGGTTDGKVTYSVDKSQSSGGGDATIDENGVLTPVKVGTISVTATMAGNENYNDVTSWYFVISITKGTPTGAPNYTKITTGGKTLADAALTTEGGTFSVPGTVKWELSEDTVVKANTAYKWVFTPADAVNYTTLTSEIELYHVSSGGSSGYSYYTIKATAGTGGSISPSGNVSVREGRDQAFTITPDKGYAISDVKIDGKSIGAVKSYTFEKVKKSHTVEVSFAKVDAFADVPAGSYYEEAVNWAVENGITQGTDTSHFSPDGVCTRAQAVTFLWRAAGSPAPKSTAMAFTDIPAGSYYYNAVLWAIENGVTVGTSATTFSPNAICTRAQIVTFLWRAEKSPAAGSSNPFTDVAADAYYADAVLWAVKENITAGTTTTTFSPYDDCTRAQIVTFLYRMYQAS